MRQVRLDADKGENEIAQRGTVPSSFLVFVRVERSQRCDPSEDLVLGLATSEGIQVYVRGEAPSKCRTPIQQCSSLC